MRFEGASISTLAVPAPLKYSVVPFTTYPDSWSITRYGTCTLMELEALNSTVWNCAPTRTSGDIVRSLDAINSLSGSAEKQPVMVVVSMTLSLIHI